MLNLNRVNPLPEHFEEIVRILLKIKDRVDDKTDIAWTRYDSVESLKANIESLINRAKNKDKTIFSDLEMEFGPTSTFQKLSISNGWGADFLRLASMFDDILQRTLTF